MGRRHPLAGPNPRGIGAGAAQGGGNPRRGGAPGALATRGELPGPPRAKHTPGDGRLHATVWSTLWATSPPLAGPILSASPLGILSSGRPGGGGAGRARGGYDDHDPGLRWAALRFAAPGAAPRARQKSGPRGRRGAASHEEKEEKKQAARRGGDGTSRQQAGVAFSSPLFAQWFRTSARSHAAMEIDCGSLFATRRGGGRGPGAPGRPGPAPEPGGPRPRGIAGGGGPGDAPAARAARAPLRGRVPERQAVEVDY